MTAELGTLTVSEVFDRLEAGVDYLRDAPIADDDVGDLKKRSFRLLRAIRDYDRKLFRVVEETTIESSILLGKILDRLTGDDGEGLTRAEAVNRLIGERALVFSSRELVNVALRLGLEVDGKEISE